jgi:hypothetical protein
MITISGQPIKNLPRRVASHPPAPSGHGRQHRTGRL